MLPKLDLHGGRGAQFDKDPSKTNASEAVVSLPRLRLLRQVTSRDEQTQGKHGHHFHASPRSPLNSDSDVRRGRGMVRPVRDKGRSPSPMRHRHLTEEQNNYMPQHDAQQRVRQHMRQKRRKAKEEEELRVFEEKERQERMQKSMPQVEAYRRELARKAAELHRREKVEKEIAAVEQEQLASARRERVNRYIRPDAINEHLRRFDNSTEMSQSGEERRPAGSSVRAIRLDDEGRDVVVSGSFATGSVRARHKVLLSPRRQGTIARKGQEEGFHHEEAPVEPGSFQGSESVDVDEKKPPIDAAPTSIEPSPGTGVTSPTATGVTGPTEGGHQSQEASHQSEVNTETLKIPADASGTASVQPEPAASGEPSPNTSQAPETPEAPAAVSALAKEVEIPTGVPEQETGQPSES